MMVSSPLTPVANLKRTPQLVSCPVCRHQNLTKVEYEGSAESSSYFVYAMFMTLCCIPCFWICATSKGFKNVVHYCSHCGLRLATCPPVTRGTKAMRTSYSAETIVDENGTPYPQPKPTSTTKTHTGQAMRQGAPHAQDSGRPGGFVRTPFGPPILGTSENEEPTQKVTYIFKSKPRAPDQYDKMYTIARDDTPEIPLYEVSSNWSLPYNYDHITKADRKNDNGYEGVKIFRFDQCRKLKVGGVRFFNCSSRIELVIDGVRVKLEAPIDRDVSESLVLPSSQGKLTWRNGPELVDQYQRVCASGMKLRTEKHRGWWSSLSIDSRIDQPLLDEIIVSYVALREQDHRRCLEAVENLG